MKTQQTLAMAADQEAGFAAHRKPTRPDEFLKQMGPKQVLETWKLVKE